MPHSSAAPKAAVPRVAQTMPRLTHTGPIAAAEAKTHLLRLIDEVSRDGVPVIISKRGKPMVQIAPLDTPPLLDPFGCMKDTVTITGDIVGPEPERWEAMQ